MDRRGWADIWTSLVYYGPMADRYRDAVSVVSDVLGGRVKRTMSVCFNNFITDKCSVSPSHVTRMTSYPVCHRPPYSLHYHRNTLSSWVVFTLQSWVAPGKSCPLFDSHRQAPGVDLSIPLNFLARNAAYSAHYTVERCPSFRLSACAMPQSRMWNF